MSDARAGLSSTKISVSQAIVAAIVYCASFFIFTPIAYAELQLCLNDRCDLKKLGITGRQELVGIAMYLNGVKTYHVNAEQIREISDGTNVQLEHNSWLVIVGRFNALAVQAPGLTVKKLGTDLHIFGSQLSDSSSYFGVVPKPQLASIAPVLNQLRYQQLWWPLAKLALAAEFTLTKIQAHVVNNWGLCIVVFSLLFKLVMLPVSNMTARLQLRTSQIQSELAPKLLYIKQNYDGEEAHNRLMATYKDLNVSPFYTLKPMIGTLIQIPVLIAVFNALGEMPQLDMQSFLWVKNLAYPDAVTALPVVIPGIGGHINLLPFLMTAVTLFSTLIFSSPHASATELKKQRRNLYMMAAAFFILFYPFPAAMVLFWTVNNLLHSIQQIINNRDRETLN